MDPNLTRIHCHAYAVRDADGQYKLPRFSVVRELQLFPYFDMMRNDYHPKWREFTQVYATIRERARPIELIWFYGEWLRLLAACGRSGKVGARAQTFAMQLTRTAKGA